MHASSALPLAEIGATVLLTAWMITGFTPVRGSWLRWKMFCRATFVIVDVTGTKNGRTESINVYDYLSPGSFTINPPALQKVLDHLADDGYEQITGRGRVLSARGEQPLEVNDGHVVVF